MPNKTAPSFNTAMPAAVDTFQALANIYLTSAERMLALNLSTLREAVEDSATAMSRLPDMKAGFGSNKQQATFVPPMLEKTMAYSRSAYEILAATQQEVTQMLTSQMTGSGSGFKIPTDWNAPFELFAKSVQQFSTLAAKGATATTEAGSRALSETLSKVRRAA